MKTMTNSAMSSMTSPVATPRDIRLENRATAGSMAIATNHAMIT